MTFNIRSLAAAALLALSCGCLEVNINGEIRQDGAGELEVSYVVIKEFFFGKYAELQNNKALPLNEAEIKDLVGSFSGATLIDSQVEELGEQKTEKGRKLSLLRVRYRFAFKDINEVKTNHFRFAYYPFADNTYFQFRVDKRVPPPGELPEQRPTVNPLAEALTHDRNVNLTMTLPGKVMTTNGLGMSRSAVSWAIPMRELLSTPTPSVVAWAALPKVADPSLFERFKQTLSLEPWKDPQRFGSASWSPITVTTLPHGDPQSP